MNKQARKIIVLVAVFAVLIGVYFVLDNKKKKDDSKKDDKEETKEITLVSDFDTKQVSEIAFKSKVSKDECSFVYDSKSEEDAWTNKNHKDWNAKDVNLNTMVTAFSNLKATSKIETEEEESIYGFDEPTATFTIKMSDNKEYKGKIGDSVPTRSGEYYFIMEGDKNIYSIASDLPNSFEYTEKQLVEVESVESVTSTNMSYGLLDYADEKKDDIEVKYDGKREDTQEKGTWYITKPYENKQEGDESGVSSFLTNLAGVSFKEFVDVKDDLSKYGLDEPSYTIKYKYFTKNKDNDEVNYKDYEMIIGKKVGLDTDNDGEKEDYYYVTTPDAKNIYIAEFSQIESLDDTKAITCVSKAVNNKDLLGYKDLTIQIDDDKYVWSETSKKEKKDGDENETITYYYKFNGEDVEEIDATGVYNSIKNLVIADKEISKNVDKDTPIATFTYSAADDKDSVVVKYLPYDNNYYRVNKNGDEYFLIKKGDVDEALKKVKEFGKKDK